MSARAIAVLVVSVLVLGVVVAVQGASLPLPGNQQGYEPDQPVRFSHQVHAGDLRVDCQYCHYAAERGRHAGLPPDQICMGCHKFVAAPLADVRAEDEAAMAAGREARPVVSPEIRKLYDALALDERARPVPGGTPRPLEWVRVHSLPDHVYFDHRSHVSAAIACNTCHGPVEGMHRIRQQETLLMGWCVNCHRQQNAAGLPDGRPCAAPTDCNACHH